MHEDDLSCSDASLHAGEPLAGTAAEETSAWIVLESRAPWGPKGVEDSGLPQPVQDRLNALSKAFSNLRVQLIRRPSREEQQGDFKLYAAKSGEGSRSLTCVSLASLEELTALDLEGWLRGTASIGEPVTAPLFLVCVHGRRDRCCAQKGMPLYSALLHQRPNDTWMTTHLGGHRFAATMVVLPEGICYGRVPAQDAKAIIAAHERSEIYDLAHVRGRCAYDAVAQAAEVALRMKSGALGIDDLSLDRIEKLADAERVHMINTRTQTHVSIDMKREALPPISASCGAPPKRVDKLVVLP